MNPHRPLSTIAAEISRAWPNVNYAAVPYLRAMRELNQITDFYGQDSAHSVVVYFLSNAAQFKGPAAKLLKAELKTIVRIK
jgi:hypothetical protein